MVVVALSAASGTSRAATAVVPFDCTVTLLDQNNLQLASQVSLTKRVDAPPSVTEGSTVTVVIPAIDVWFPSQQSGFAVGDSTGIATTYEVLGGTIVPGSLEVTSPPRVNGIVGTSSVLTFTAAVTITEAGPVPAGGTLTTSAVEFQVTPTGGSGSFVHIVAAGTRQTTQAAALGRMRRTCTPPPSALVPGGAAVLASTAVKPAPSITTTTVSAETTTTTLAVPLPSGPSVSVGDVASDEGWRRRRWSFPLTLSQAVDGKVRVRWTTTDGTATAGSDYVRRSGSVVFKPRRRSQRVKVVVKGDRTAEPDETFGVTITSITGAAIGDGTGTGTILNDDVP